jgi:hypothetical protein
LRHGQLGELLAPPLVAFPVNLPLLDAVAESRDPCCIIWLICYTTG